MRYRDNLDVVPFEDRPEITERGNRMQTWNTYAAVLAENLSLPIMFRYVKSDEAAPEDRRLEDVELKVTRDGDLIIAGYDPDRLAARSYRIDRITDYIAVD